MNDIPKMMPSELGTSGLQVKISRAVMNDLEVRCPDEDGCWRGIDNAGNHWISHQQARELLSDCAYQGNIGGDYIDPVSPGVTRAYRALHSQLSSALASVKT